MYEGESVGVVVPAFNEQDHIEAVIESIPLFVDVLYVVDDASTDTTWEVIGTYANELKDDSPSVDCDAAGPNRMADISETGGSEPRVIGIRHRRNKGVGGAIKTGYRHAHADDIDVTVVMAGDGQMDPGNLDRIIEPIVSGQADYAKGNRFTNLSNLRRMPSVRIFGSFLLSVGTKMASGYWDVGDPQNGYTAISWESLERIDIGDLYDGYGFCNDVLIHLNVVNASISEVRDSVVYGEAESYIDLRSFIPTVMTLLVSGFVWRMKAKYLRRN